MIPGDSSLRRGSALLAAVMVITLTALLVTTMVMAVDSASAGVKSSRREADLRAIAWSGIQGAMAELEAQHSELMKGGEPHLTAQWEAWKDGDLHAGVRLIPWGKAEDAPLAQSESAKLDLNRATPAMLRRLPEPFQRRAGDIVRARAKPLTTVESLGVLTWADNVALYGEPEGENARARSMGGLSRMVTPEPTPGLADLGTVFSFDPDVQLGVVDAGRAAGSGDSGAGQPRVHVGTKPDDPAMKGIEDRLGKAGADAVRALLGSKDNLDSTSRIVGALRSQKVAPELWGEILDFLTTGDDAFRLGRVDINRAGAPVLGAIPGIGPDIAPSIVEARQRLDPATLIDVTWPLREKLLTPDQFQQASDWLCVRSLQWKIRVEASMSRQDTAGDRPDSPAGGAAATWEAVIDVSDGTARLATMRDITHLALSGKLRLEPPETPEPEPAPPGATAPANAPRPAMRAPAPARPVPKAPGKADGKAGEGDSGADRAAPPGAKDRRIGRWRSGSQGSK